MPDRIKTPSLVLSAVIAIVALTFALPSHAMLLKLKGSAGSFAEFESTSTDGTPIALDIPNTLPVPPSGSRSSSASGTAEAGIIRLTAETAVTTGAQSLGSIRAEIDGTWTDTLNFASPGTIGGLLIVDGVTAGTTNLIFFLDGSLQRIDSGTTGNSDPKASYNANLSSTCITGACFESMNGEWDGTGTSGDLLADGTVAPIQLILADVSFIYGVDFDLTFSLSVSASLEQGGGLADADYISRAMFGSTAAWGGVQDVMAFGTLGEAVALGASDIMLTNSTGQDFSMGFDTTIPPVPIPVAIDIKPGSDPNSVNPRSNGVIPVAVLGSTDFDAMQVDFSTVTFGPDGASPKHDGHVEDVNDDGFMDMTFHFKTQETGIVCGDTDAALNGETFDGTAITGADRVNTVGCK